VGGLRAPLLMSDLAAENERLKEENEELKKDYNNLADNFNKLYKKTFEYNKHNQQNIDKMNQWFKENEVYPIFNVS